MEEDYNMDAQDASVNDAGNRTEGPDGLLCDPQKEFGDSGAYDDGYEDEEGPNSFRNNRGRGNFRNRGRGPPPGWMNGPPMRFRGRGYGPAGPPLRGRQFFRTRGSPRFSNFEGNWGPMGPPPPMMGGPPPFGPPPGMMPPGGPMGPPPNMMGQPPPFAAPPSMPPPNIPAPELWVEAKSEEGKPYYYHSRTRETTWTRPQEGPACKVVTHAEVEAMAANSQMNQAMMGGGPGPGAGPMAMPPGVMPGPAPNMPPQFMNQPPPWLKEGGQDMKPEELSQLPQLPDGDDAPPGEAPLALPTPHANGHNGPYPGGAGPPFSSAPPGYGGAPPGGGFPPSWPAWGGWPPPLVANPPPNMAALPDAAGAQQMPPSVAQQQQQPDPQQQQQQQQQQQASETPPQQAQPAKKEIRIPAELEAAAGEWSTHAAPDGRPYYYHAAQQLSVWDKPAPLRQLDELRAKIQAEKDRAEKMLIIKDKEIKKDLEVIDVDALEEAAAAERDAAEKDAAERDRLEREKLDKEKQDKEKQEKEKLEKDKEKANKDRSRPISSTPISGTPWCVVWTGDGRVFFYNPTAHASVWERPPALQGRPDVDRAVTLPPPALQAKKEKEAAAAAAAAANSNDKKTTTNGEKRPLDTDDDSDPEHKKAKTDDASASGVSVLGAGAVGGHTKGSAQIEPGAEAAMEAEVRAARERGSVPLAARLRAFRDMLRDRNVSAFSCWEKELHKIVFDPRYLMLNSKERRQAFDQYVRDRAEEERKEKKNRILQKKQTYRALLEDANIHSKSSFAEFSSKYARDERFKAIEKARERELYFNEYVAEVRKKEKEEKEKKREQTRAEFVALLREKGVERHARFSEVKKRLEAEPRYKAVESGAAREDYFRDYCKQLKDDRKKDKDLKERERSSKKEKKDKDSKKDKKKDKPDKSAPAEEKGGGGGGGGEGGAGGTGGAGEPAAEGAEEGVGEEAAAGGEEQEKEAREREARALASIREREREVQRALATSLRDRDKEREHHKRDEAVQHFNALLADLVRNPELSWREAKKQLKKDHRYNLAELLTKEDKERLFSQHTTTLCNKRRDKLRALLQERGVTATTHWRDVKCALEDCATGYSTVSQMEREFREYQRDLSSAARAAFRQLLQETRALTHRSLAAVRGKPGGLQPLHDHIRHDARYAALDHVPEEREELVRAHVEELHKRGPPPPPTATEPQRRTKL